MRRCLIWPAALCFLSAVALAAGPRPGRPRREVGKVASYYIALAHIHADFGKFDAAAECYRHAVEVEKEHVKKTSYRVELASALIKAGKLDEADKIVQEAIDGSEGRYRISICSQVAKVYQQSGKLQLAEKVLKKAIDLAATPREKDAARLSYLRFLDETGSADKLAASYLQRLEKNPKDAEALAWMAEYHLTIENDIDKGLALYEKLLALRPNDPHTLEQLAVLYLANTMADKAIELYQRVAEVDKTKANYAMEQISCIEASRGNVAGAIEWNNKVLAAGGQTPDLLYRQAKLHRQARQYPLAIEHLQKAIKANVSKGRPPDAYALELIDTYQAAGRIEDAINEARKLAASAKLSGTRRRAQTRLLTLLRLQRARQPRKK